VGTSQRFGVPMGFGGPHAAFFATKDEYKRAIPGRIIGLSKDKNGNPAYRMALQTREQHIKRERATSNICTAQVLLAVMASMYAVYHGPDGLRRIARRVNGLTKATAGALSQMGIAQANGQYFDTLRLHLTEQEASKVRQVAEAQHLNFRYLAGGVVQISFDESHSPSDAQQVVSVIGQALGKQPVNIDSTVDVSFPEGLMRKQPYLQAEVFQKYQTEHELLRYMKRLENKDLSLVHSMISLGSCTMKLNATTEMLPVTWQVAREGSTGLGAVIPGTWPPSLPKA